MRSRVPFKIRLFVLVAILLAPLVPPVLCQGVISVDVTPIAFTPPEIMVGFSTLRAVNGRSIKGNTLMEATRNELTKVTVMLDQDQIRSLGVDGPYGLESTEVLELAAEDRIVRARRVGMEKTPPLKLGSLVVLKRKLSGSKVSFGVAIFDPQ